MPGIEAIDDLPAFVQRAQIEASPPPSSVAGPVAWIRNNLFGSITSSILTILCLYLLWVVIPPLIDFLFVRAVWEGSNREACIGPEVGACWAFVRARFQFFVYGFYPAIERWRVDVVFILTAIGVVWLLWPKAPHKNIGAIYFFIVFPIVSFFLLSGLESIGLTHVPTNLWGGIFITLLLSVIGIVVSLPLGVLLALGRRSHLPAIRLASVIFIEFVRGVPLITVLFMASVMLPLFVPANMSPDKLLRAVVGISLFASAYMAEVIRGGLQALPRGQYEGASALGLGFWQTNAFIILPQALTIVIPGIVNTFIGLFKDTTLVYIVGIFDLLKTIDASLTDPSWATPVTRYSGYAFAAVFYFVFCFGMSRYSIYVEKRLAAGRKR
jgi:general L-amino acid transport system permease protein